VLPRFTPSKPATIEIATGENIPEIDQKIPKEVSAKESQVSALDYFNSNLDPWKSYQQGDVVRVKISYNDHDILLPRDEALRTILGQQNFQSIPQDFLSLASQQYDVLVFKGSSSLRLGIAFKYDQTKEADFRQAMLNWEKTNDRSQKIYNVMKALFGTDRFTEDNTASFQPSMNNGTELRYVNLPDSSNSMDYFIYNDLIVFTTSKDTAFQMMDLVRS